MGLWWSSIDCTVDSLASSHDGGRGFVLAGSLSAALSSSSAGSYIWAPEFVV